MKTMYYRRVAKGFVCAHCGALLDDHPVEPDKLVHPASIGTTCEFAGRKVYNPDVFSG